MAIIDEDIFIPAMLTGAERQFLETRRVAHLATADGGCVPHVVAVCYALEGTAVYIAIDEKPKRQQKAPLKRLRNIAENPAVAFICDRYDDSDWSRLAWVMLRGRAEILEAGDEYAQAQRLLRQRYPQYNEMDLARHPLIAIRIERATSWGELAE